MVAGLCLNYLDSKSDRYFTLKRLQNGKESTKKHSLKNANSSPSELLREGHKAIAFKFSISPDHNDSVE